MDVTLHLVCLPHEEATGIKVAKATPLWVLRETIRNSHLFDVSNVKPPSSWSLRLKKGGGPLNPFLPVEELEKDAYASQREYTYGNLTLFIEMPSQGLIAPEQFTTQLDAFISAKVDAKLRSLKVASDSMSYSEYFHQNPPKPRRMFDGQEEEKKDAFDELGCSFTRETEIQKLWNTHLVKDWEYVACIDSHASTPEDFKGRRPDLVLVPRGHALSALSVVAVGELTVDDFSPAKMGELLSCVHRILNVQPFRLGMYSWLAGSQRIEFFKTEKKEDGGVEHFKYGAFRLDDKEHGGARYLRAIFHLDLGQLAYNPPTIHIHGTPHPVTDLFGRGASAMVYKIQYRGQAAAAKVFRDRNVGMQEQENLARCKHANLITPLAEGVSSEGGHFSKMLLLPVISLFRESPEDGHRALLRHHHLPQLVDAIEAEHKAGLIDRDIRPANVGVDSTQNLVKFDLAFATKLGTPVVFQGTLRFASDRILKHLESTPREPILATQADDLHSIVRTAFSLLHPQLMSSLDGLDSAPLIAAFWKEALQGALWIRLGELASLVDYGGMKELFRQII